MQLRLAHTFNSSALRLGLATAATLAIGPAVAGEVTVRDLTGPSLDKPGQIFEWSEAEGAYYVMVPDLGEIWRVSAEGYLMERASVFGDGETVTLLWPDGYQDVFFLDDVLNVAFTGEQASLVQDIAVLLTLPLCKAAFGLPKEARFKSNQAVVDPDGRHLGSWDVATGGIVTLTDSTGARDVPISKLLEVLGED